MEIKHKWDDKIIIYQTGGNPRSDLRGCSM